MACGTPVVASNRSSVPEVVGDAGLLFDPEQKDELTTFYNPGGRCVCARTIDSEGTAAREGFQLGQDGRTDPGNLPEVSWNRQDAKSAK